MQIQFHDSEGVLKHCTANCSQMASMLLVQEAQLEEQGFILNHIAHNEQACWKTLV